MLVAGHATAQYQIPATAGLPGSPAYVNSFFPDADLDAGVQYWNWWHTEGYVHRTDKGPPNLHWIIPLPFYQSAKTSNAWTATIMVSANTKCRLYWAADELPGVGGAMTEQANQVAGDGPLDLTAAGRCPSTVPTGCTNDYATAWVDCMVPRNGFVGAVTYTITPPSADAAID